MTPLPKGENGEASVTAQTDSKELNSERVAGGILPQVLTTFDMVAIFVAIVLFITNSAAIQPAGPAAYGWWLIGFVVFLIPCAIATGQLGVMFPGEGSIYLWTHKAFGRFWGFFAGFCAWWPGVLVMVATGTLVISFLGYAFPAVNHWSVQEQGLVVVGVIVLSAVLAVLRFRVTQNLVNVVFGLYGLAILAMFVSAIVFLARGHHAAVNPWDFSQWAAGSAHGLNFTNWTFFGLVVLALLGVEVPLNMGVEIRDQRAVTRYLIWGSLVVMVAYVLATWGVMVTVHGAGNGVITNVAQAVAVGLGSAAGKVTAVVLALFFLFITVVYNYSFAPSGDVARQLGPRAGRRGVGADGDRGRVHADRVRAGAGDRGRELGQLRNQGLRHPPGRCHGDLVYLDRGPLR